MLKECETCNDHEGYLSGCSANENYYITADPLLDIETMAEIVGSTDDQFPLSPNKLRWYVDLLTGGVNYLWNKRRGLRVLSLNYPDRLFTLHVASSGSYYRHEYYKAGSKINQVEGKLMFETPEMSCTTT